MSSVFAILRFGFIPVSSDLLDQISLVARLSKAFCFPLRLSVLHLRVPVMSASFVSRPQSASVTSTEFLRSV